jgi:predicted transcriptional regulator
MPTLIELTAAIVSAHVSNQQMTSDEMLQELQKVHASLKALESGSPIAIGT